MIALRRGSTRSSLRLVRQQVAPTCCRSLGSFTHLHDASNITRTSFRLEASQWLGRHSFNTSHDKKYFSAEATEMEPLSERKPIKILFGTQGGTSQIFSMQLEEAIAEVDPDREVSIMGLNEAAPSEIFQPGVLHIIFISVAGIGEAPDNAREFYSWLMDESDGDAVNWSAIDFAVFGLGNAQAHPHHFNVIGKNVDARLGELGANRIHEIGLGDDGDCIEDDCDIWVESLVSSLTKDEKDADSLDTETKEIEPDVSSKDDDMPEQILERQFPDTYKTILLRPATTQVVRGDLFHLQHTSNAFYSADTCKMRVRANAPVTVRAGEYGMREMCISLEDHPDLTYEAGDHILIYPRNSNCLVDAYVDVLGVDPHTIIEEKTSSSKHYPHPSGITLKETLSHCVDLGALPSPSFSRELLGRKDVNYKEEIAAKRRTVLDMIYESGHVPTLEDMLLHLAPMKPRYYSIASSPLIHPREVYITYRPVKYVTKKGMLREGVCTSYLANLGVTHDEEGHDEEYSFVPACINSNPSFRLPKDVSTPVVLVAGGCGVAPIRSFLEERIAKREAGYEYGEGHMFLGFRNPQDEVYRSILEHAMECGAITTASVSYASACIKPTQKCALVTETVQENGEMVYDAMEQGGYIYLCGGARSFGVAIEKSLIRILEEHGNMSTDAAIGYLRKMSADGRLCEDYADRDKVYNVKKTTTITPKSLEITTSTSK